MERLILDARTLLVAARAVGLAIDADGDRLSVRGPKGAAELAHLLVAHKLDILTALESEHAAQPSPAAELGPPSNMDAILDHIAARRGGRIVEMDGGRT